MDRNLTEEFDVIMDGGWPLYTLGWPSEWECWVIDYVKDKGLTHVPPPYDWGAT